VSTQRHPLSSHRCVYTQVLALAHPVFVSVLRRQHHSGNILLSRVTPVAWQDWSQYSVNSLALLSVIDSSRLTMYTRTSRTLEQTAVSQKVSNILKGDAARLSRRGRIVSNDFVSKLLLNRTVNEFWKSISIWQFYGRLSIVTRIG